MVPIAHPTLSTITSTQTPHLFNMAIVNGAEEEEPAAGEDLARSYDQLGAIVLAGQQTRSMPNPVVNPTLNVDFSQQLARGVYTPNLERAMRTPQQEQSQEGETLAIPDRPTRGLRPVPKAAAITKTLARRNANKGVLPQPFLANL